MSVNLKRKKMNRCALISFFIIFSSPFSRADNIDPEWRRSLNHIAIHYIASVESLVDRDYESTKDGKDIREFVVSTMPFWFNVFIAHDKFEKLDGEFDASYQNQIKKLLSILNEDEIRAAFSVYLDPQLAEVTTFSWPVKGYTLSKFKKDFPDFLKLRTKVIGKEPK